MDFLRLNKLHLISFDDEDASFDLLDACSFELLFMTNCFFTFFFNGLSSSFDNEDTSFDFLDSCSFEL